MIIVYLQGGLGNQMFQYATGRRLAHALGVTLKLDLSRLVQELPSVTPRQYALDRFCIQAEHATAAETAALHQPPPGRIARLFSALLSGGRRTHIYQDGYRFDPAILSLPDNILLDGYWQSEKYFADAATLMRSEFRLKGEPAGADLELANSIAACNAVSVHIRRGDYLSEPSNSAKYARCTSRYYLDAVAAVAQKVSEPRFFIFSDDPAWVKEQFAIPYDMTVVGHNGPEQAHEDLRLMRLCRHHIIANSSFSWWGAWLDPSPDKIVIAPKRWFNDHTVDTSDLLPDAWLRLPQ